LHLSLLTFALSALLRLALFYPHVHTFAAAQSYATFLPARAGSLALGAALACYGHTGPRSTNLRPAIGVAVPAGLLLLFAALRTHTLLLNNSMAYILALPAASLLAAALLMLALRPNGLRTLLSTAPLRFLGRISYGFYVLHILLEPVIDDLGKLITHTQTGFLYQAVRLLTAFPLVAAAATVSFYSLERPFLKLKRRFPHQALEPAAQRSAPVL
jgi:peptidoglycan/LPS O-acetylase OafA/YrhL